MTAFWNNLSIRSKLTSGIGALLVIFAISLAIDAASIQQQAASMEAELNQTSPLLDAVARSRRNIAYLSVMVLANTIFHGVPAEDAFTTSQFALTATQEEPELQSIDRLATPEDRALADTFQQWYKSFLESKREGLALAHAGKLKEAAKVTSRVKSTLGEVTLRKFYDQVRSRSEGAQAAAIASAHQALFLTVIAAIVSLSLGIMLIVLLTRTIATRLQAVTAALDIIAREGIAAHVGSMKRLAGGDLTVKMQEMHNQRFVVNGNDEPAKLMRAYNHLVAGVKTIGDEFTTTSDMLAATVGQIKSAAEQVGSAAREISAGTTNLSQRTEEQASGLEETASSMEQFTATVRQNADAAQEANVLGAAAQEHARKSGATVADVVATMDDINARSRKIVEITSVIDGIAFQTNILALNAAVEAARAGEQGRGFAVVAGEVRSLAQRSADAAKEIKGLIDDTVAKVSDGSHLVAQAGSTMAELVESVQRVTAILSDIATASREQSSGIDQVNKAIAQMDDVTQQNAALVEEAAAATGSLEEQAHALLTAVASFTVEGARAQSTAPDRPTPAPKRTSVHKPAPRAVAPGGRNGNGNGNGKAIAIASAGTDSDWTSF